jgi:hypothetical protein
LLLYEPLRIWGWIARALIWSLWVISGRWLAFCLINFGNGEPLGISAVYGSIALVSALLVARLESPHVEAAAKVAEQRRRRDGAYDQRQSGSEIQRPRRPPDTHSFARKALLLYAPPQLWGWLARVLVWGLWSLSGVIILPALPYFYAYRFVVGAAYACIAIILALVTYRVESIASRSQSAAEL